MWWSRGSDTDGFLVACRTLHARFEDECECHRHSSIYVHVGIHREAKVQDAKEASEECRRENATWRCLQAFSSRSQREHVSRVDVGFARERRTIERLDDVIIHGAVARTRPKRRGYGSTRTTIQGNRDGTNTTIRRRNGRRCTKGMFLAKRKPTGR